MPAAPDDRRATFEAEALPHLDSVYRVALRLSGDRTRAEDLTQETMLRAFRAWDQYRQGTNARAWLLTILRHTFINEYRRTRNQPRPVDVSEVERYHVPSDAQEADPEGAFFERIVDDEVLRAIDALPAEFREVVVLSDIEGLTYAEMAELVGVPIGTIKSRLYRGRRLLQQRLYNYAVEMGYVKPNAS